MAGRASAWQDDRIFDKNGAARYFDSTPTLFCARFDLRKPMTIKLERFSDTPWEEVSDCARQKLIDDGEKRVRLLKLAPGFQEQDWCTRGHTGYVIDGTLEMEFGEGTKLSYSTGDAILLSQGTAHKARTGTGAALLFLIDDV